jgi:hypothetical protein
VLNNAALQGANLLDAQLQGAWLQMAGLQGAWLHNTRLQGAWLQFASLQGALLDNAKLQGASLDRAQLRSASVREAFIWRTDARMADATDAWINSSVSGPIMKFFPDWSAESFSNYKQRIEKLVPEGARRESALARVNILNPETPLREEQQMAEYWNKLQSLSPAPADYEAKLANQWRLIGCSADGAPYVLAGLIRTMDSAYSPFSSDSVEVPRLAAAFLKDDCAGAPGLSEDARATLKALRDRAARSSINPSSQTQ